MLQRQQQQQQQHFPPINKPQRYKFLQDVTQQPYRIGMVQYYPNNPKSILEPDSGTDTEDRDPGRELLERNQKERLKRMADYTKEELEKVLKRVDNTINNYEYSVQSSLIQHGMPREDMNSVEHVQDIKELEYLLNDNLAKQRYKQRLMVFIVGQTEQASEKAKLLQQLGQFFAEQKQNFSGPEFNDFDDTGDTNDEIETTLKSFDVKDCYLHVKTLTSRINELNEEMIQFLIQNTGTKQTKVMVERGKRKLAQVTKEAKEQLADLQSKLEMANTEMTGRDGKIQQLEKDIEVVKNEVKSSQESQKKIQDELKRREGELKYFKRRANELEEYVNRYKIQIGDLSGTMSVTSQSETEDGDDASKMNLETIDENDSKYEKESVSSRTAREQIQSTSIPPTTTEATNTTAKLQPSSAVPTSTTPKATKKSKSRDRKKGSSFRSKKEQTNQNGAEDPSEIYRRSQQLLESLLADKSENAPDLNSLFKPTRGIDLNNVTIDNLPTAFTNLRKFAIARVRDLLKELETKESANKETVQILKQEFVEHKTTYEKERLLYFLSLDPEEKTWQEEQNALAEKADHAHKLQIKAQKTAEDALNHLELFMAEQEKLDQQDVVRQTELVHRHSVVVNNMTGANITPPAPAEPVEEPSNDRLSPHPRRSTPMRTQWKKLSSVGTTPPKNALDESKSSIYDTAQTLKRLSSTLRKTPPSHSVQRVDSVEQPSPPTPSLRRTTQELLRKKSSLEQSQHDRSSSSSRRISMAMNDDANLLSKPVTPQPFDRTPSMHSRPLTRSNSINPVHRDQDKNSSGERSHHTSGPQSRRVSIGLNRSPVRAEELERVLTKLVNEEIEALENFRRTSVKSRTSLREKYMSLLEEKKHELDDLKLQADQTLSRPTTSTKERKPFDSLDNSANPIKKQLSFSPLDISNPMEINFNKENQSNIEIVTHDQEQQTSIHDSRPSSAQKEKPTPPVQIIQTDQYKVPFFHLYETIYKFRHSITNLLEQNKFISLADRLEMIKQLSSNDQIITNDFVDNSEQVLKDTVKVLQTCLATINKNEIEQQKKSLPVEQTKPSIETTKSIAEIHPEKDSVIEDLNTKHQQVTQTMNENQQKYQEELTQNERVISEQQKLIANLQRELMRLQKRLSKVELEGVVQPSIMFTRLDAQRNEETLKKAVEKGKISETASTEINETMNDYNRIPSQQFANIIKRYIQHRKATELQDRIQSETFDNEARSVMERMGSFYERRSGQISDRISSIRQHRTALARDLTEKFDNLEHESSIFLVRPIYSYQGRAAVQSYMANEKRQQESITKGTKKKKKRHRQTDSTSDRQSMEKTTPSSTSASDDEDRLFNIEKSFTVARPTPASQQSTANVDLANVHLNAENQSKPSQLGDVSRLQELDIQRTLMPMSHSSVSLTNNSATDPTIPSSNLRSYVALSRPGMNGNNRNVKSIDTTNPVSRIELSVLSETSQLTNPRTPFNSTVGVSRRTSPPLPPIKRSLTTSKTSSIEEKPNDDFIASVSTNEFTQPDQSNKDNK